jgi:hypothetical protein
MFLDIVGHPGRSSNANSFILSSAEQTVTPRPDIFGIIMGKHPFL